MQCPYCRSKNVRRSLSHDSKMYRIVLLVLMRCHCCFSTFFVRSWQEAKGQEGEVNGLENRDAPAA